jgi:hypothetical protein
MIYPRDVNSEAQIINNFMTLSDMTIFLTPGRKFLLWSMALSIATDRRPLKYVHGNSVYQMPKLKTDEARNPSTWRTGLIRDAVDFRIVVVFAVQAFRRRTVQQCFEDCQTAARRWCDGGTDDVVLLNQRKLIEAPRTL